MFRRRGDELKELLKPIRARLAYRFLLRQIYFFLLWGLGISASILLISRFIVFFYYKELAWVLLLLVFGAACLFAYMRQPDERQAAVYADSQGLLEKVSTALEYQGNSSRLALYQREDAIVSLRKRLPEVLDSIRIWPCNKRQTTLFSAVSLVWLALFLYPNPLDDSLKVQMAEKEAITAMEQEVEKEIEDTKQDEKLSEEQQQKIAELLEQIKKNLREKEEAMDKLFALEDTKKDLARLQEQEQKKHAALEHMQQKMLENQALQEVANALTQEDQQVLLAAMEQLFEIIASFSPEEREELASLLEELGQDTEQAAEELNEEQLAAIAEQLQQAAEQLRSENLPASFEEMKQALTQAQQQTAQMRQMNQRLAQALGMLQQAQLGLAQANPAAAGFATSIGQSGTPGTSSSGQGSPSGSNSSSNPNQGGAGQSQQGGQGGQNGSGSGSGQGSGNGSGNGGSGSGSGGNGNGQGSGAGLGMGSRDMVTVPSERIDAQGGVSETVGGPLGEGARETRWSSSGQVSPGVARPYAEVYRQYQQIARESMERNEIPSDYEELVKQYFSEIEP